MSKTSSKTISIKHNALVVPEPTGSGTTSEKIQFRKGMYEY